ncbi:hypothetical protein U1Q18_038719 [Sarracenia purpurea var. burkii]
MEISSSFNCIPRSHRRRRQYRRLNGKIRNRKKVKIIRFGGSPRWRFWRIKPVVNLHLKMASAPLKLWNKLKNAYINVMLNFAGNVRSMNNGDDVFRRKGSISEAAGVIPEARSFDDFESRLAFEILKSIVASKELVTPIGHGSSALKFLEN